MTFATHPTRMQLLDYALGRLPIAVIDAVAEHIDACAACAVELSSLDGETDPLVAQLHRSKAASTLVDPL
jgi:anti-sigma factor RsiW